MAKINDLIAEGKLAEAGDILYETLYTMLTSGSPRVSLNRNEFAKVAPELVKKLQNPVTEKEKTEAPGDDVEIIDRKNTAKLVISFTAPEGVSVPKQLVKNIIVGLTYNYAAPTIEGYTVEPESITGTMTEDGAVAEFVYTAVDEEPDVEPPVVKSHKLTIMYIGPDEDADFTAPDEYEADVNEGAAYSVDSPVVRGYTPDQEVVSGTMGTEDVEVIVEYIIAE